MAAFDAAGVPQIPAFLEFQTAFGGYNPDPDFTDKNAGSVPEYF